MWEQFQGLLIPQQAVVYTNILHNSEVGDHVIIVENVDCFIWNIYSQSSAVVCKIKK